MSIPMEISLKHQSTVMTVIPISNQEPLKSATMGRTTTVTGLQMLLTLLVRDSSIMTIKITNS